MSRIIQLPGRPLLKITIEVDDKGQAQFKTDRATHPAMLAKVFAACSATCSDMVLAGINNSKLIQEGGSGEAKTPSTSTPTA